jgi:hypothetical protein
MSFKCIDCDTKYHNEKDRDNCDSWITESCVKSITMEQWRHIQ